MPGSGMHCGLCGQSYGEDESPDDHNAREHPAIVAMLEASTVERLFQHTGVNPEIFGWRRWLAAFGSEFAFIRRFLGGHWEQWYVGSQGQLMWLDVDRCSVRMRTRPPNCFGTPTCESHG